MHLHQNNNMFIVFTTLTLEECKNIIVIYKLILLINIISMYYTGTMSLFPALVCWFSIIKCLYCQCYSDSGEWSYIIVCNGLIDYL